jgi:hypothetical protein
MARYSALAVLLAAVIYIALMLAKPAVFAKPATSTPVRKAVVVELFTSEGCSSCPPADELLGHLRQEVAARNIQVIPLGFHVDYWNSLGWKDRFSSADFSKRQEQYARRMRLDGPYTPQMVVDGELEFVGNSAGQAQHAISQAATQAEIADVNISVANDEVTFKVTAPSATGDARVMLAITEDNLTTKVGSGENGGRTLHHAAVVRHCRKCAAQAGERLEARRFARGGFCTTGIRSIRNHGKD